jgi:uncharacterized protein (DUF2126 family)
VACSTRRPEAKTQATFTAGVPIAWIRDRALRSLISDIAAM